MPAITFDHKPLFLSIINPNWRVVITPFRFEAFWLKNEESLDVIIKEWEVGRSNADCHLEGVLFSVTQCSMALK